MNAGTNQKLVSGLIGGSLFIYCTYYMIVCFEWESIFKTLTQVNLAWLLGAGIATIIVFWLIRTLRWMILLKAINVHMDFFDLYMFGAIAMALSTITPLQTGEALKIELIKKFGTLDRVTGYSIFMAERILDIIVIFVMASCSLLFFITDLIDDQTLLLTSLVILICFIILFLTIRIIPRNNFIGHFLLPLNNCLNNRKYFILAGFLSICSWLVIVIGWHVCLRSISIILTFAQVVSLTSIITIISQISMVPGAVGISELGIATLLIHLNYKLPEAQAGGIILRVYSLLVIVLGLAHYILMSTMSAKVMDLND